MTHLDVVFFGILGSWSLYSVAIMTIASIFGLEHADDMLLIGELSLIGLMLLILGVAKISKRFRNWLKE